MLERLPIACMLDPEAWTRKVTMSDVTLGSTKLSARLRANVKLQEETHKILVIRLVLRKRHFEGTSPPKALAILPRSW